MPLTALGLFVNPHRARELQPLIGAVAMACRDRGLELIAESALAGLNGISAMPVKDIAERADALIVLGGDGTVLHAMPVAARAGLPILGVHAGNKGFLSEVTEDGVRDAITAMASGDYTLEYRMTLWAKLVEPTQPDAPSDASVLDDGLALNDVVITRGSYARMIRIRVWADDTLIGGYDGDGLIVASPTGSTGYALSAGGPVVHPDASCIQLCPICPHASQSRPIILPDSAVIAVDADCPSEGGGMLLTLDGRAPVILGRHARMIVRKSETSQGFIRLKAFPFYERLRNKLDQWTV